MARVMLRANGNSGFLFVNNFVRKLPMPERRGFQARIKLPSGTINLPNRPIDLPANSYFIWPLNLDLGAGTLNYSTAQLLSCMNGKSEATYFFFAIPGLRTEFAFDADNVASVQTSNGSLTRTDHSILIQNIEPGRNTVLQVTGKNGRNARIILLTQLQAERFWRFPIGGIDTALLSPAELFADTDGIHLRSKDPALLTASLFQSDGSALWHESNWKIAPRKIDFDWSSSRQAAPRPAIRMASHVEGRDRPMPQAPEEADFAAAAAWTLKIPSQPMASLSDIFVRIHYAGDVARLSLDGRLLDDNFFNGSTWEIGLKRFLPDAFDKKLEVSVLPLPSTAPIYLDARAWQSMNTSGQTARIIGIEVLPEYEVVFNTAKP